jgi:response regulator RpfG family c-di-GMP phosphodiesterase
MTTQARYTFLLFKQEVEGCAQIESEILSRGNCSVHTVDTLRELFDYVANGKINSLIFNLKVFDANTLKVIQKIKTMTPNLSTTIVTSTKIQNLDYQKLREYKEIVVVEKPIKAGDFSRLTDRLVQGLPIYYREHKRFVTKQTLHMEKVTNNAKYDGYVYNISKGGAYIELAKGILNPGDLCRVSIKLDQISKAHNFHAEVVWISPKGQNQAGPAAGLKFISEEEMYSSLLEKVSKA